MGEFNDTEVFSWIREAEAEAENEENDSSSEEEEQKSEGEEWLTSGYLLRSTTKRSFEENAELKAKVEQLEKENKKLKNYESMVFCVWSDLYYAEKNGHLIHVDGCEVAQSCDYYDHKDFVREELVEDE